MLIPHTALHGAVCRLQDHPLPLATLPQAHAKLPLPLSINRPQALLALGFLRTVPGRMHSPSDVSFSWITEEGEGFATRGLPASRAPLPRGSLRALHPAS